MGCSRCGSRVATIFDQGSRAARVSPGASTGTNAPIVNPRPRLPLLSRIRSASPEAEAKTADPQKKVVRKRAPKAKTGQDDNG